MNSLLLNLCASVLLGGIIFSCGNYQQALQRTKKPHFRLITNNVWYGFTINPERKLPWLQWMQAQNPDVVCLQELNDYTTQQLADDALSWKHPHSILLKEDGFPIGITSRYPIEDIQRYLDGFHHGLLRVRIRGIYYYVVHLHPSNWEIRGREVDQIIENIERLPTGARTILAGDFNTFSSNDTSFYDHGKLEPFFAARDIQFKERNLKEGKLDYGVIEKLIQKGFVDLEHHFRPEKYSFTGSFPTLIEKAGDHGDLRRLDYVFVSSNLLDQITDASIVADSVTQLLSDHLPMKVDF